MGVFTNFTTLALYRLQVTLLSENTYEIFSILDQVGS
jgi:hypothetical protein